MCLPKAPGRDLALEAEQKAQKQAELDRLAKEKDAQTVAMHRLTRPKATRSLLADANPGSGFGSNYPVA